MTKLKLRKIGNSYGVILLSPLLKSIKESLRER